MPRFPARSRHTEALRASTFAAFASELARRQRDPGFVPLHLGDTALLPPLPARRIDLDDLALHRYGPVAGDPELRAAGAEDLARLGLAVPVEQVFVTPGATGALDVAISAVLDPGDEVLVCTPSWPLILGILQRRGCVPVEVDVDASGLLPADAALLEARLEAALTPRTAALYLCDPNNPVGFVYGPAHLAAIRAVAERHDLWLLYDAVYADFPLQPLAQPARLALPAAAAARTFAVTSFSKSLGLAGQRVGLLAAPPAAVDLIPRALTHSTYHAGTLAQRMALAALRDPDAPAERARRQEAARRGAERTLALLDEAGLADLAVAPPAAGTFVFLDLRERCPDEAAVLALLRRCLEAGVSLAPGAAFGASFALFARLCFTATELDALAEGVRRVARALGPPPHRS